MSSQTCYVRLVPRPKAPFSTTAATTTAPPTNPTTPSPTIPTLPTRTSVPVDPPVDHIRYLYGANQQLHQMVAALQHRCQQLEMNYHNLAGVVSELQRNQTESSRDDKRERRKFRRAITSMCDAIETMGDVMEDLQQDLQRGQKRNRTVTFASPEPEPEEFKESKKSKAVSEYEDDSDEDKVPPTKRRRDMTNKGFCKFMGCNNLTTLPAQQCSLHVQQ